MLARSSKTVKYTKKNAVIKTVKPANKASKTIAQNLLEKLKEFELMFNLSSDLDLQDQLKIRKKLQSLV